MPKDSKESDDLSLSISVLPLLTPDGEGQRIVLDFGGTVETIDYSPASRSTDAASSVPTAQDASHSSQPPEPSSAVRAPEVQNPRHR